MLWQQIGGALEGRVLAHLGAELRASLTHEAREDQTEDPADTSAATADTAGRSTVTHRSAGWACASSTA